jgi:hypothetical protein
VDIQRLALLLIISRRTLVDAALLLKTRVSFFPNSPTHKHCERSQRLARHVYTPCFNGDVRIPLMSMDRRYANPILDYFPKPLGMTAMGKEMSRRLLRLLAKWTNATIIPPPSLKAVRHPNPITDSQPRKELDLWGCLIFPHHLIEIC